jgi:hypothetical protein
MLPPPLGREGVTLLAAAENKRITQKKRISTKPKMDIFLNFSVFGIVKTWLPGSKRSTGNRPETVYDKPVKKGYKELHVQKKRTPLFTAR